MPERDSIAETPQISKDVEKVLATDGKNNYQRNIYNIDDREEVATPILDSDKHMIENIEDKSKTGVILDASDYDYTNLSESVSTDINSALRNYIPNTAPEKFSQDRQQERACAGNRQRHGMSDVFKCHKIDLDEVNPFDVKLLGRFLSEDSEILSKKRTGLCSKCQRKVSENESELFMRDCMIIFMCLFVGLQNYQAFKMSGPASAHRRFTTNRCESVSFRSQLSQEY
jgi:ribosomal protein S18